MNTKETNDILKTMFRLMPEEKLSLTFQQEMMVRIRKDALRIRRRNSIFRFLALAVASLIILSLAVLSFIYLEVPEISIPKVSISPLYLFIGIASLVLLFGDYLFRKVYYRKHPELK